MGERGAEGAEASLRVNYFIRENCKRLRAPSSIRFEREDCADNRHGKKKSCTYINRHDSSSVSSTSDNRGDNTHYTITADCNTVSCRTMGTR